VWPRAGRGHGDVVRILVARQLAAARRHLRVVHSQETVQCPEAVSRFRRTRRKSTVLGRLTAADGVVGATQLRGGEGQDRNDAVALVDELHVTKYTGRRIITASRNALRPNASTSTATVPIANKLVLLCSTIVNGQGSLLLPPCSP